jgi:hypothetical protein
MANRRGLMQAQELNKSTRKILIARSHVPEPQEFIKEILRKFNRAPGAGHWERAKRMKKATPLAVAWLDCC